MRLLSVSHCDFSFHDESLAKSHVSYFCEHLVRLFVSSVVTHSADPSGRIEMHVYGFVRKSFFYGVAHLMRFCSVCSCVSPGKGLHSISHHLSSVAHYLSVVSLVQVIIIWVLLWCVFSCFVVLRFSVSAVVVLRFTVSAVVVLRFVWCSSLIVVSLWVGTITVYEFFYLAAVCNGYSRLVIPYLLQSGGVSYHSV